MRRSFTESNWHVKSWVILAIAALVAVLFYLVTCVLNFGLGFPLDDAWIHLTYARNLAEHGEWAFRLGEQSAGSTSPLWTALLSIGFLIGLGPHVWTYLAGWAVLVLLAAYADKLTRKLVTSYRSRIPWAGLFFVFAWHLTWSAVSGMETLLHGLIILAVLGELMSGSRRYLTLGLLTGLSVWVRPDGLTLLGPIIFVALLSEKTWHLRGEAVWKTLIGFGSLVLPYVLFNLALSGNAMPNTFYAKQAEYGSFWESKPFLERIGDYLAPILAESFPGPDPGRHPMACEKASCTGLGRVGQPALGFGLHWDLLPEPAGISAWEIHHPGPASDVFVGNRRVSGNCFVSSDEQAGCVYLASCHSGSLPCFCIPGCASKCK